MDDLIAFLKVRLDEDDLTVREANTSPEMVAGTPRSYTEAPVALHIARFANPDRVLREVEAKRRLVDQYERAMENRRAHPDDLASAGALLALHGTVKGFAAIYADHPEYRQEWAP